MAHLNRGFVLAALHIALSGCGGPLLVWHGRSPDSAQRARLIEQDGVQRMILDGVAGPAVDGVGLAQIRWTSRSVAYPARVGDRWCVVAGGERGPSYEAIGEVVTAGDRVAYAAVDGEGWRVVVDGEPGPPFQSLRGGTLRLFREGRRSVYVGRGADGERAVVDGEVGPSFDHIGLLSIGAKGALVGYVGWTGEAASLVLDGVILGGAVNEHAGHARFEDVLALALASHEPRFAAIVALSGAPAIVHDGVVVARPAEPARLTISADGAHVAWTTRAVRRDEVWLDGRRVGAHDAVDEMRFVPRTGALVYVASDGDDARVVHAGEPGPRALAIESLVTSGAGHWGYVSRRANAHEVVIDGVGRFRGEWAGALALAEGSGRWAFVTRRGERRFVVTPDGRAEIGPPFIDTLVLDPGGSRWAIAVQNRREQQLDVVVDGRRVASIDLDEVGAAITQGREALDAVRSIIAGELARAPRLE